MTELFRQRERQGVTRRWLAAQLGISRTALWRYERGDVRTPKSVLFHAAHLLHVSLDIITDVVH